MASSSLLCSPQTPPCRSPIHRHRRLESFPTDNIHEGSEIGVDDEDVGFGMPESISLGAFPVFLLQESPGSSGIIKSVPQFPESPESTYGFQSPATRAAYHKHKRLSQLHSAGGEAIDYSGSISSWGSQGSTPTKAPHHVDGVRIGSDRNLPRGELERKLSLAKAGMEFGRRLYPDEDETLVGHGGDTKKPLRPIILGLASSTSTSLISPQSDIFSAGSTACSISTSSSRFSPKETYATLDDYPDKPFDFIPDGFPTEVGGTASLDLQERPYLEPTITNQKEFEYLDPGAELFAIEGSISGATRPCVTTSGSNSGFALPATHIPTPTHEIEAPSAWALGRIAFSDQAEINAGPSGEDHALSRPFLKQSSYNHLVQCLHSRPRSPHLGKPQQSVSNSSQSGSERSSERTVAFSPGTNNPTVAESQPGRRRALSVASERLRELREELISQSGDSGRLRSGSVSSQDNGHTVRWVESSNNLIEQAARSRSNSASGSVPYILPIPQEPANIGATTRTLSSSASKDSLRTKFANLPTYVTFLREITLELWIDQEGFRAVRPQFELHRYTPGQRSQVRSIRLGSGSSPTAERTANLFLAPSSPVRDKHQPTRPRTAQPPSTPPRAVDARRPSSSESSRCSLRSASPEVSRFSPKSSSFGQEVEQLKPQFLENWGVAEFTMKKRRGWNFHHGMVDGDPMIRRLTINGVEDRDYLSREASLSVRSNGVYTVKGSEDRGRFSWKFEYLVEDRRGPTGAIIQGEKTLTPLTFSCAPELLIPEQGKKVKLLHVMKKSMAPKLSALKMDPPLVPGAPGGTPIEEHPHGGSGSVGKTFETLAKIVRPSTGKSRSDTPKLGCLPAYSPFQTPVHQARSVSATTPQSGPSRSTDGDEGGGRRAASFSSQRPDLKKLLGDDL
ncbi:hypothetical protein BDV93DRAFT_557534 [Ceratobasidium sp. AG-I]|nr:hypothetical protein BDV93DRAFT_557534 [Ceratobasidium sp. AG-I]